MMQDSSRARRRLEHAGIVLTKREAQKLGVADFGLGEVKRQRLELIVYMKSTVDLTLDEMPRVRASSRSGRPLSLALRETPFRRFSFTAYRRCLARKGFL